MNLKAMKTFGQLESTPTSHPCEYKEEMADGGEMVCGKPACVRLTGEKVSCKPWTILVCDDHRHIAGFVMELRDYTSRKETFLLDTAEGQIANLEDALLDAVRCFIGDYEPTDGTAVQWLDALLRELPPADPYSDRTLLDYIIRDHQVKAAVTGACEFLETQEDAYNESRPSPISPRE